MLSHLLDSSKMIIVVLLISQILLVDSSKHYISIKDDGRKNIPLSTFGFFEKGRLLVDILNFSYKIYNGKEDINYLTTNFGFTLQKTKSDGLSSYLEKKSKKCVLNDPEVLSMKDLTMVRFQFFLQRGNSSRINVTVFSNEDQSFPKLNITDVLEEGNQTLTMKEWLLITSQLFSQHSCGVRTDTNSLGMRYNKDGNYYSGAFAIMINCAKQSGLYNLYFHTCDNYDKEGNTAINLTLRIIEKNPGTYLSAGKIPLPSIYLFMSLVFFGAAILWTCVLRKRRTLTYKIHWLMAMVVYLKALSLLTHGLSFHYTGKNGIHVGSWAILYYIIHLFKGALLFATIVLIGTGYFFIKHVLSSKEKKLFVIVIPLQIIANVTQTIMDSTEEGNAMYSYYFKIALAVDLLCCGAILLPVIWSIKHLTEAAKTDGKAAISLRKLKLFRQFYIMIVCYIYFTRIIIQLMKVTVPFHLMWLCELFSEAATYFFFVFTGWKFRPVDDNPYLHLPQDDDEEDIEMNDISEYSSYGERINRVNVHSQNT